MLTLIANRITRFLFAHLRDDVGFRIGFDDRLLIVGGKQRV